MSGLGESPRAYVEFCPELHHVHWFCDITSEELRDELHHRLRANI